MRHWYLQSTGVNNHQALRVVEALDRCGIPHTDAPIRPFEELTVWPEGEFIVYGSNKLVEYAHRQGKPGVFFDPQNFNVRAWSQHHRHMLNDNPYFLTAGQLRAESAFAYIAAQVFQSEQLFVRPVHDLKPFQSTVARISDFEDVDKYVFGNYEVPDNTQLILAAPKYLIQEIRCFIVGSCIRSMSQYRFEGRPNLRNLDHDYEVHYNATRLLSEWVPHENCVMDIALTRDGWKIVEFNNINCSGFYDHDIDRVVTALSAQEWL